MSNNKELELEKKKTQKETSAGVSVQQENDISKQIERAPFADYPLAAHDWRIKEKILCVEGIKDKDFYEKIVVNPYNVIKIEECFDLHKLYKQKIISFVFSNYILSVNVPEFKREFYGIVDRDYDYNNNEIIDILSNSIRDNAYGGTLICRFIFSDRLTTTTEANDVEALLFCYGKKNIESLYLNNIPNCSSEEILKSKFAWNYIINIAINKAYKLGILREISEEHKKKKNEDSSNQNFNSLKFKYQIFSMKSYFKFNNGKTNYNNYCDYVLIDDSGKREDIDNFLKQYYQKHYPNGYNIYKNQWIKGIDSNLDSFTNPWDYCRGHDLTAIIACLLSKVSKTNKPIADIDNELQDKMIKSVNSVDFKDSEVYKFIKRNNL